jgi:hypothetical protein
LRLCWVWFTVASSRHGESEPGQQSLVEQTEAHVVVRGGLLLWCWGSLGSWGSGSRGSGSDWGSHGELAGILEVLLLCAMGKPAISMWLMCHITVAEHQVCGVTLPWPSRLA